MYITLSQQVEKNEWIVACEPEGSEGEGSCCVGASQGSDKKEGQANRDRGREAEKVTLTQTMRCSYMCGYVMYQSLYTRRHSDDCGVNEYGLELMIEDSVSTTLHYIEAHVQNLPLLR